MKQLALTSEEFGLLSELIEGAVADIRAEIGRTDSTAFKDKLKERKVLLVGILGKLGEPTPQKAVV